MSTLGIEGGGRVGSLSIKLANDINELNSRAEECESKIRTRENGAENVKMLQEQIRWLRRNIARDEPSYETIAAENEEWDREMLERNEFDKRVAKAERESLLLSIKSIGGKVVSTSRTLPGSDYIINMDSTKIGGYIGMAGFITLNFKHSDPPASVTFKYTECVDCTKDFSDRGADKALDFMLHDDFYTQGSYIRIIFYGKRKTASVFGPNGMNARINLTNVDVYIKAAGVRVKNP